MFNFFTRYALSMCSAQKLTQYAQYFPMSGADSGH